MVFDNSPLTAQIADAVSRHWNIALAKGERLHGGEESSAYRLGDHVVRIGPDWRSDEELEWAYLIAALAADVVPEAVSPIATGNGRMVVRIDGRPISVWPLRNGAWPHAKQPYLDNAANLLARLHNALCVHQVAVRPGPTRTYPPAPELDDAELDRWLEEFRQTNRAHQLLHGDFYRGNTLAENNRLTAVLDWDDAYIGSPERELACAAWEWGDGLRTLDLSEALRFIDVYVCTGGTAKRIDDTTIRQLVRERIRFEVGYERAARARGKPHDDGDSNYEQRQLYAFQALRPE